MDNPKFPLQIFAMSDLNVTFMGCSVGAHFFPRCERIQFEWLEIRGEVRKDFLLCFSNERIIGEEKVRDG